MLSPRRGLAALTCGSFLLSLVLLLGCSGGSKNPLDSTSSAASAGIGATLMADSAVRHIAQVTLDGVDIFTQAYLYAGNRPGATRVFEIVPAPGTDLAAEWSAEGWTASGLRVEWTAPTEEREVVVHLTITTPDGPVNRLFRINVQANPPQTDTIIPNPLKEVEIVDPHPRPGDAERYTVAEHELLVQVKADWPDVADMLEAFSALHCQVITRLPLSPVYNLYINDGADSWAKADLIATLPFVEISEPVMMRYLNDIIPNDPDYPDQYCLPLQSLPPAWEFGQGDANQIVAIMDTGTGRQHPDLAAKCVDGGDFVTPQGDGLGGDVLGDGVDNNGFNGIDEGVGHGVHCSGISAAISDNGVGGAGMSWNSRLMGLRIFPTNGDSGASSTSIAGAHDFIAAHNNDAGNTQKVVSCNMSFGGGGFSGTEQSRINAGTAAGITYCASAGNANTSTPQYPANYANVISVSSVDDEDVKSSFSSFGTWVDVAAAGSAIWNTYFHGPPGTPNPNIYAFLSGTSMSCPQVTGLAALIKGNAPELTPEEVAFQIMNTTDNIDAQNPNYVGRLGTGRINAFKALTVDLSPELVYRGGVLLDDSEVDFAHGNRDGRANADERINLLPLIENIGLSTATDVTLEITNPSDPFFHLLTPSIEVSRVTRAEGIDRAVMFPVVVDPLTPDNYEKTFDFTATDADSGVGPWSFSFAVRCDTFVKPSADVVAGTAASLTAVEVFRPSVNNPFLAIDLAGDQNYLILEEMTVSLLGTVDPAGVANVRLWLDNGNGTFNGDFGDTELGLTSYWNETFQGSFDRQNDPAAHVGGVREQDVYGGASFTGSTVTFTDLRIPIPEGETGRLFLSADITLDAAAGTTVGLGVLDPADVAVSSNDALTGFPWVSVAAPIISTWGTDRQFTFGDGGNSWRTKAAVDANGRIYTAYDDNRFGDFDILMQRSADGGLTWLPEQHLVTDPNQDFFPDVAIGPGNEVYMSFYTTRHGNGNREIYFKKSTDNGANWGGDTRVTNEDGNGRVPRIVAGGGAIHIAWFDEKASDGDYNVYYTQSTNGGTNWSGHELLSTTPANRVAEEPQIVLAGDTLYSAWYEYLGDFGDPGNGHRVVYNFRPLSGSWGSARVITGSELAYGVKLAPTSDGRAFAAYHSDVDGDADIWIQVLNDGATDRTIQVTNESDSANFPSITRDDAGRIDVAYSIFTTDGSANIFHLYSEDDGTNWTPARQVSSNPGGVAEGVYLIRVPGAGHLHAFWNDDRIANNLVTFTNSLIN